MALLPPFFLNTVVAVGIGSDPAERAWIGTGFLYGDHIPAKGADSKPSWRLWLITNKHVVTGLRQVFIKFNSADGPHSDDFLVPLISRNGKPLWVGHPTTDVDVAAIAVPVSLLKAQKSLFAYFQSEAHTSTKAMLKDNQITEGDRVFVLGFPMGLVASERQYVICRGGVIARIRDYLDGKTRDFLVDATVFPGNSGGPVVLCPSALAISGTKPVTRADLIGVVKSYVPYSDMAVSSQTRKARIIFEENSGLAAVEPLDAIVETVKLADKRLKNRVASTRRRQKQTPAPPTTALLEPSPVPGPTPAEPARRR